MQHLLTPPAWLSRWVALPILAYWVSWMTGWGVVLFFPILLTAAQWYALRGHSGNTRPSYWPMAFILYIALINCTPKWRLFPLDSMGYSSAVLTFYATQCLAELILFLMFAKWQFGWYTVANAVACFIWCLHFQAMDKPAMELSDMRLYVTIPTIALVTNLITGLGLMKAPQTN